jgi:AcrR family transcriptional regulator
MTTGKGGRYHHGSLRAALIDGAIELIGERGVHGFSLAEASRQAGVSVSAPYRHFADREQLLVAVAMRACDLLLAELSAETGGADAAADRLAAAARAFVRFAAANRPLFETLVASDIAKGRHPELERAARPVTDAFVAPAAALCGGDARAGEELALAVVALARGFAEMLLEGVSGGAGETQERAARATLALAGGWRATTGLEARAT